MALKELHQSENVTEAPNNCNKTGNLWETGKHFFEYIRRQILPDGVTGRVAFDSMGDRIFAEYEVYNVQNDPKNNFANGDVVGNYKYSKVRVNFKNLFYSQLSHVLFFVFSLFFGSLSVFFCDWSG